MVYKTWRRELARVEVVKVMTGNPTKETCARFVREARSSETTVDGILNIFIIVNRSICKGSSEG